MGSADAELAAVIAQGAAALQVNLEGTQLERFVAYLRLIERWNSTYNLTAVRDLRAMATQHIVDSLSVVPVLRGLLPGLGRDSVLDVGSGAGLPGVVLAMVEPGVDVTCVDSVGKKAAFITQAATTLALPNLLAVHTRVEKMRPPPTYDVVISRAFASLVDFIDSTRHLLAPSGTWLAMKGKVPDHELAAAEHLGVTFEVEPLHVPGLNAERCLIRARHQ